MKTIFKSIFISITITVVIFSCSSEKKSDFQKIELLYRLFEKNTAEYTLKLSSFFFLTPYSVGVISGTDIAVNVPSGTTVTALVASFAHNGTSLTVNGVEQTSGTTANDFTNPVTYSLTGSDGSVKNYTVTVTIGQ
ncbi:MAG: hypothetical protein H7A23_00285 [Leptospiraceae bacterium]|nr:hypothetical protein [Leptospiraceae bacterium]MCP5492967.1 hypothetical protein [Leptospiraceae bacterium]